MGITYNIAFEMISRPGERPLNEDFVGVAVEKDRLSFLLCDGLGGHGGGDVASAYVVGEMKEQLEQGRAVEDSILRAQEGLLEKQREENAGDSMKTTLTCLSIEGDSASMVHVGDSRIYHFENGKYRRRTQDHSVPQMLVNSGMIKERDIRHHEDRSRLLRVMGTEWSTPKYQVADPIGLSAATSFLLCSDGFWELIEEKWMEKTLKRSSDPKDWLARMEEIVLSNGRGTNMDNYSAIAVFLR